MEVHMQNTLSSCDLEINLSQMDITWVCYT